MHKRFAFATLLLLIFYSCGYAQSTLPNKKYQLVWEENFSGATLDTSRWNVEVNDDGGGNNELQYYTNHPQNIFVENGLLHLRCIKENYLTRKYTSGRINTKGKADFRFGRMDIRAKSPAGRGLWPAIWMMPTDNKFGDWPTSGEIDIMEIKGQSPDTLYGTQHFGRPWPHNQYYGKVSVSKSPRGFADSFHVYSIIWEKNSIQWLVDGRPFFISTDKDVRNNIYPFNERFHFILDLAIGGGFVGNPDEHVVPAEFLVDYIKVWQQ